MNLIRDVMQTSQDSVINRILIIFSFLAYILMVLILREGLILLVQASFAKIVIEVAPALLPFVQK